MTENELIDEIRDYVHNIHTAEPFHGFSFRELREVGEHFALPREKRITELEVQIEKMKCCANCEYTPPFDKHCDNCIQGGIKLKYRNWKLRR